MKAYQKVKIENQYNSENIESIELLASEAIDYMGKHCEYAIDSTHLTNEGFIRITFAEGQEIDEQTVCEEMQEIFDEKFAALLEESGY